MPVGVGSKPGALELGRPPVRCRSMFAEPKNQALSLQIGPPTVPPNRLSTHRGTTGFSQVVAEGLCPGAQNGSPWGPLNSGDFSSFFKESKRLPCQNSYPVPWNWLAPDLVM